MSDTMQRDYFWTNKAFEIYKTSSSCGSCAENSTSAERGRYLRLFTVTRLLQFVTMNISGPGPETTKRHQRALVITDHYSKLTRAIHITRIPTNVVAEICFNVRVIQCGIPANLLTDDGSRYGAGSSKRYVTTSVQKSHNDSISPANHLQGRPV